MALRLCATCTHWWRQWSTGQFFPGAVIDPPGGTAGAPLWPTTSGECRKRAPSPRWPTTLGSMGCGEWKASDEPV